MPNPAPARPVRQIRNEGRGGGGAELSGFEQLNLPLRTPRLPQPHTLCNCAVAWGGDQLRGFVIALGGAGRSCGASRHRGKPGRPSTPLLQLKKAARTWQGFSDPKTSRGSFSSPRGAYAPFPDTFLQLRTRATTPMPASRVVVWLHGCSRTKGGTQPQMRQVLRQPARQAVSNHLAT